MNNSKLLQISCFAFIFLSSFIGATAICTHGIEGALGLQFRIVAILMMFTVIGWYIAVKLHVAVWSLNDTAYSVNDMDLWVTLSCYDNSKYKRELCAMSELIHKYPEFSKHCEQSVGTYEFNIRFDAHVATEACIRALIKNTIKNSSHTVMIDIVNDLQTAYKAAAVALETSDHANLETFIACVNIIQKRYAPCVKCYFRCM